MPRRAVDLNEGVALVVTDLHGDWDVYRRVRDLFLEQQAAGNIDRLVICGDLIHREGPPEADASLKMLLDVMLLQSEVGQERVIMLLGNHEMPHIYGIPLLRGEVEYTPRFEAALAQLDHDDQAPYRREDVVRFLSSLPFLVRTKGGVLLTHAGATSTVNTPEHAERLVNFDHDDVIASIDRVLGRTNLEDLRNRYGRAVGKPYDKLAQHYLAVSGPDDPRYNHLLRSMFFTVRYRDYTLLWDALFTRNELDHGPEMYQKIAASFLQAISEISPYEQRVILAGHIPVEGGCVEVNPQHFRLATSAHAIPRQSGSYLLLDCEKQIKTAWELRPSLRPMFAD